MELRWRRGSTPHDAVRLQDSKRHTLGWVTVKDEGYGVELAVGGEEFLECEKQQFVTLRDAMRALKAAVVVTTLRRNYEL